MMEKQERSELRCDRLRLGSKYPSLFQTKGDKTMSEIVKAVVAGVLMVIIKILSKQKDKV